MTDHAGVCARFTADIDDHPVEYFALAALQYRYARGFS